MGEDVQLMVNVRLFDFDQDYEEMVRWVATAGHEAPAVIMLPAIGSLVEIDGKKIGCAFLYLATDCPVAFLEFLYFNPEATPKEKHNALGHLIKSLEAVAKGEAHNIIFTLSKTDSMGRIFKKNAWLSNGDGYSQLIKIIEPGD